MKHSWKFPEKQNALATPSSAGDAKCTTCGAEWHVEVGPRGGKKNLYRETPGGAWESVSPPCHGPVFSSPSPH